MFLPSPDEACKSWVSSTFYNTVILLPPPRLPIFESFFLLSSLTIIVIIIIILIITVIMIIIVIITVTMFFYCYWCRYIIITTTIINIITLIIIIITISLATSHHKWHSRKALRLPQNQLIAPHRRTPQHEGPRRQWHRYPILKDDKSRSRIPWTVGSPACNLQSAFWLSLQHDPLLLLLLYGATLGNFPDINSTSSCLLFKCFPGV